MKSYKLLYSEFWKQIIAIITLPLLLFFPLVAILVNVKGMSDAMVFGLIFGMMALAIVITVYIYMNHVNVLTSVSIGPTGIDVTLDRKTLFFRFTHLSISYTNITSVTDDEDVQNNYRRFYNITLRKPSKRIILMAPKKQEATEMQQFSLELHKAIREFNGSPQTISNAAQIREGSFYSSIFAKGLTIVCTAMLIIMAIVKVADPDSIPWYKFISLYSISLLWMANYVYGRKKEKEKASDQ